MDDRLRNLAAGIAPAAARKPVLDRREDPHAGWKCAQCASDRWVASSFDGGVTRRYQCVPCGAVGEAVVDG